MVVAVAVLEGRVLPAASAASAASASTAAAAKRKAVRRGVKLKTQKITVMTSPQPLLPPRKRVLQTSAPTPMQPLLKLVAKDGQQMMTGFRFLP